MHLCTTIKKTHFKCQWLYEQEDKNRFILARNHHPYIHLLSSYIPLIIYALPLSKRKDKQNVLT